MKMTKAKFMYELIDQCMLIRCQDNILVENFELSDDDTFYEKTEMQFVLCLRFYDDMKSLLDKNEISEAEMDQELSMVLALIRQKALRGLLEDFKVFLEKSSVSDKEAQILLLEQELKEKIIDAQYLINKVAALRLNEQEL